MEPIFINKHALPLGMVMVTSSFMMKRRDNIVVVCILMKKDYDFDIVAFEGENNALIEIRYVDKETQKVRHRMRKVPLPKINIVKQ